MLVSFILLLKVIFVLVSFILLLKVVFLKTRCFKSSFLYKDRLDRFHRSKVVYKASRWDCNSFYIGKLLLRHIIATGHNINWDHFKILASRKADCHYNIKETLFIQELNPTLNINTNLRARLHEISARVLKEIILK